MVIAPLSWCRGEWVDYTFAANLAPCLFDILQKGDIRVPNDAYRKGAVESLPNAFLVHPCNDLSMFSSFSCRNLR